MAEPQFICSLMAQCQCGGEVGEIGSGGAKLVPERCGSIAGEVHGMSLSKNGVVDAFGAAILS